MVAEKSSAPVAPCGRGSLKLLITWTAEMNRDRRERRILSFPETQPKGCATLLRRKFPEEAK